MEAANGGEGVEAKQRLKKGGGRTEQGRGLIIGNLGPHLNKLSSSVNIKRENY